MKTTTITTTIAGIATAAALPLIAADNPKSPIQNPKSLNVIFFLADDMGYGDLAKWGSPQIAGRMASEGIRIDQFYVMSPICSASRTGLTTGTYPQRWGITSFLAFARDNANRGMANYLTLKAPTLAHCLQNAGYATGHFGKWHMGGQRDVGDAPLITQYGFDESLTQFEGLGDRILPQFSPDYNPKWNNGKDNLGVLSEKLGRGKCTWVPRWKETAIFIDRAITFIEKAKKEGKPFYVNIWPDDVHAPHEPSADNRGGQSPTARGAGRETAYYGGVMKEFDVEFGRLMEYIRNDPDLRDNTIVIYASDNGAPKSPEQAGSNGHLRGFKGQIYEGGFREPFIVWCPKLTNPDRVGKINTTSVIAGIDLAPTLLSILGIPVPDTVHFDGLDMSDVYLGRSTAPYRPAPVCWSRPPGAGPGTPDFAIRDGKWKLLVNGDKTTELYDLDTDPSETKNLSKANPQVVKDLSAKLSAWQKTVNYEKVPATGGGGAGKAGKKGKAARPESTDDEG